MKLKSFSKDLPPFFICINLLILLPIFLWPFILFLSVFIFDAPSSTENFNNYLLACGMIFYPIILFLIFEINARIFIKYKYIAYIFPITFITLILIFLYSFFKENENSYPEYISELEITKERGYIGYCKSYRKKNDSVFYKETYLKHANYNTFIYLECSLAKDKNHVYFGAEIIKNCEPNSFQIINELWSKDKNNYFYEAKIFEGIDYKSFKILKANYSKDKNSVYYHHKKIKNADPKSFRVDHLEGVFYDKNNYYKLGKKITNSINN